MIVRDLNRYAPTISAKIKTIIFSPSFHIVLLYRISSFFSQKVPFIGNFLGLVFEYLNRLLFSCDISRKSQIEGGLIVVHGMGIVIGDNVIIGKNCKILNGVNLGNKDTETLSNQQPIVGDNVVIGAGAKCLGDIVIGNKVTIGANSVVLDSVPDNSIAVGIPAKIINRNY